MLFHQGVRSLHHLAPFGAFLFDPLAEGVGTAGLQKQNQLCKSLHHFGLDQSPDHRLIAAIESLCGQGKEPHQPLSVSHIERGKSRLAEDGLGLHIHPPGRGRCDD